MVLNNRLDKGYRERKKKVHCEHIRIAPCKPREVIQAQEITSGCHPRKDTCMQTFRYIYYKISFCLHIIMKHDKTISYTSQFQILC